ncbi:MAG: hypothetical protein ACREO3_11140 [Arenimonas sp.]
MKWLLRREIWEHKGGFVWAPAVIGAIMVVGALLSSIFALFMGSRHGIMIDGEQITSLSNVIDAEHRAQIVEAIAQAYLGVAVTPLFLVMTFAVFFFCLGSLFDERKDKSVLFWKSLPVSDAQTVLAKAGMALVGAPLITLVIGIVVGALLLLTLGIVAAFAGVNLFGVLGQSATWLSPIQALGMLPIYALWALPTVGWLMMVSAWARTKPFLWAVGVPVVTGVLISWFNAIFNFEWNVEWFWANVVGRGLGSVAPGIWFAFTDVGQQLEHAHDNADMGEMVAASWQVLGTANLWIGVVLGAAMIFAAIRLRRWRDEG